MKEKMLLLHLGTPKTGTSSIQKFCYENIDYLKEQGWNYPIFEDIANELWNIKTGRGMVNGVIPLILMKDEKYKKHWDVICRLLHNFLRHNNVILSEEVMWCNPRINVKTIIAEFAKQFKNIKVIVYLRRQDYYIELLWAQQVREWFLSDEARTYMELCDANCNYYSRLEEIASIIGAENIIVRVFEKEQLYDKDVVSDFLSVLNIPHKEGYVQDTSVNERMEAKCLLYKKIFNKYVSLNGGFHGKIHIVNDSFDSINKKADPKIGYLTFEERKEIWDKYNEGNRKIAEKYLGRTTGKLFYDENLDIPIFQQQLSEEEKELLRLCAKILVSSDRKRQNESGCGENNISKRKLKKYNNKIYWALKMRKIKYK